MRGLFTASDLGRLYLHTLDWNARAQGAFRKVGFEISGTSWRDGHTFIIMEVRREWLEQPRVPAERPRVAV